MGGSTIQPCVGVVLLQYLCTASQIFCVFSVWLGTRDEVSRGSGGRGNSAMKRISSAGNPLDHDEPVKETSRHDPYKYSKTSKTFVSFQFDAAHKPIV